MPADDQDRPQAGWEQTESLRELTALLAASARLVRVVARRAGLSETELVALQHLAREPIGPAEVARRLDVSTAAATGIADRLEARGHLRREPHPDDRRRTALVITDSGRQEMTEHLVSMFVALDRLDRDLDPHDRAAITAYLRGATAALESVLAP